MYVSGNFYSFLLFQRSLELVFHSVHTLYLELLSLPQGNQAQVATFIPTG